MLSGQPGMPMSISWELFETHFERRQQCSIGMTGAFRGGELLQERRKQVGAHGVWDTIIAGWMDG